MSKRSGWWIALLGLLGACATPALATECAAARAMVDGQKALEQRKEALQRPEWLLMEYLVSDGSEASKKMFSDEIQRSMDRTQDMAKLLGDMKMLPEDTPDVPEAGTQACDVITRVHTATDQLLATREGEIRKYLDGDYKFIGACDQIGMQVQKGILKSKPRLAPQLQAAKMTQADFDSLATEMSGPSTLEDRTRYAYAALRCLRNYQGLKVRPLAASSAALAKCNSATWEGLGRCVNEANKLKQ